MPSRTWIPVTVVALALLAIGGVALAEGAIPGPDGIINACRNFEGGRLRVVPSGTACRTYERPLKWERAWTSRSGGCGWASGARRATRAARAAGRSRT
jgi:hypothetical protein